MRHVPSLAQPTAAQRRWLAVVAACLLMAACSGIKPMELRDDRENPALPGVFTGEEGAWIIYRNEGRKSSVSDGAQH